MENNNKWCRLAVYRVRDKIRFQTVLPGVPGPALTDGCLRGMQGSMARGSLQRPPGEHVH